MTRRILLHLHHILVQPPEPRPSIALQRARAAAPQSALGVLARRGRSEGLADELLDDGLQDGEAAAGDADVDLDGGPDEGAGVGVGAVGEGDGGDAVGADDADGTDAWLGLVMRMMGEGENGTGEWVIGGEGAGKTYKAPTAKTALSATFRLLLICSCHTMPIGKNKMTKSIKTFGTAVPMR